MKCNILKIIEAGLPELKPEYMYEIWSHEGEINMHIVLAFDGKWIKTINSYRMEFTGCGLVDHFKYIDFEIPEVFLAKK